MSGHRCHARQCCISVPPRMLMCRTHWFAVPKKIRDAVWNEYRAPSRIFPTTGWGRAADAAIGFLSLKELGVVRIDEARALNFFGFEVFDRSGSLALRPKAASMKGPEEG